MKKNTIGEIEVVSFLKAVEDGSISLRPEQDPQDVYAGNVSYVASNGWVITVFNDANEWDYIDRIQSEDDRVLDFDEIDAMASLRTYIPSAEISWNRYGIPGYMKYKCKKCGVRLTKRAQLGQPFLCDSCRVSP